MMKTSVETPDVGAIKNPGRRLFVLKSAAAAIGALALGRLIGKETVTAHAADGDPLIIGHFNAGTSTTFLKSSPAGVNAGPFQTTTSSPDGHGLAGVVDTPDPSTTVGLPIGVAGYTQSVSGVGVNGHAGATSGQTTGVVGHSNSPDGVGVFGLNDSPDPGIIFGKPVGVVGFTRSPTGRAIAGNAAATSGQTIAVDGGNSSPDGIGVRGFTTSTGPGTGPGMPIGVLGLIQSTTGFAVDGIAASPDGRTVGVRGESRSPLGVGVAGIANSQGMGIVANRPIGVAGFAYSPSGIGAVGRALATTGRTFGVIAIAASPEGVGLEAQNLSGRALVVIGKAAFSTSGTGSIAANSSFAIVADNRVGAASHITVTLTSDPRGHNGDEDRQSSSDQRFVAVSWIERNPGVGFTVHLTSNSMAETPFTYLVTEPSLAGDGFDLSLLGAPPH